MSTVSRGSFPSSIALRATLIDSRIFASSLVKSRILLNAAVLETSSPKGESNRMPSRISAPLKEKLDILRQFETFGSSRKFQRFRGH